VRLNKRVRHGQILLVLPELLDLFARQPSASSEEINQFIGEYQASDAVTRCRMFGMELRAVGLVPGSAQKRLFELANRKEIEAMIEAER
jgi:hypothetical protein